MLTRRALTASAAALVAGSLGAPEALAVAEAWPEGEVWPKATAAQSKLDPARLEAAVSAMMADRSLAIIVLRDGRMVTERYGGAGSAPVREVASVAKSLVSVLVGMAIDDGHIKGVEQSAADFVPPWRGGPKAAITIRHLLSMTSGLEFQSLAVRGVTGDQFALNAGTPLVAAPGTRWAYATPTFHLLYHIVGRAVSERFEDYARRRLTDPLGMSGVEWVTNAGVGAEGPVTNYYTARCTTRDLARFGLFALHGGVWKGRRLVSADYMRAAVSPSQQLNPAYGYLWWENREPGVGPEQQGATRYRYPGAPRDLFAALGAGRQLVAVAPSLGMVIVRQGLKPQARALPDLVRGVCDAAGGAA